MSAAGQQTFRHEADAPTIAAGSQFVGEPTDSLLAEILGFGWQPGDEYADTLAA
jgi:hypothetical protein